MWLKASAQLDSLSVNQYTFKYRCTFKNSQNGKSIYKFYHNKDGNKQNKKQAHHGDTDWIKQSLKSSVPFLLSSWALWLAGYMLTRVLSVNWKWCSAFYTRSASLTDISLLESKRVLLLLSRWMVLLSKKSHVMRFLSYYEQFIKIIIHEVFQCQQNMCQYDQCLLRV